MINQLIQRSQGQLQCFVDNRELFIRVGEIIEDLHLCPCSGLPGSGMLYFLRARAHWVRSMERSRHVERFCDCVLGVWSFLCCVVVLFCVLCVVCGS